jgi:tetratricopeptide (TPR) repeat protein
MPLQKAKNPAKRAGSKAPSGKSSAASNGKNAHGKSGAGKSSSPAKPAPAPTSLSAPKLQLQTFERAIQLLHKRNFREAKDWFERARQGPSLEITSNAATHIRMCERRLAAPAPQPKSAEEHYNYAVALINMRDLAPGRRHLEVALQMDPRADHVHYALGVCLALSGDSQGAYDSLKRAIEIQPRNRMVARQDSDLDRIGKQPPFYRLLYPEKE